MPCTCTCTGGSQVYDGQYGNTKARAENDVKTGVDSSTFNNVYSNVSSNVSLWG